jgi:CRISPR-associated endoribonuclease Cas6
MRLRIHFHLNHPAAIPVDHQHELQAVVYSLLRASDPEFARFLHDEGYAVSDEASKRFKLFVYSGLRMAKHQRRIERGVLHLSPGSMDWLIGSPRTDFLTHSATGLLSAGTRLQVGNANLTITSVEALSTPTFAPTVAFTCLSPIVASVPQKDKPALYLRPREDAEAFSENVRANLLRKFRLLHNADPADDRLTLTFKPEYLADPKHHNGTKLVTFKGIQIRGAFAPFTLSGSTELMETAWDCGLGSLNSGGFGMIEVQRQ